jgi:hypothetical protein
VPQEEAQHSTFPRVFRVDPASVIVAPVIIFVIPLPFLDLIQCPAFEEVNFLEAVLPDSIRQKERGDLRNVVLRELQIDPSCGGCPDLIRGATGRHRRDRCELGRKILLASRLVLESVSPKIRIGRACVNCDYLKPSNSIIHGYKKSGTTP